MNQYFHITLVNNYYLLKDRIVLNQFSRTCEIDRTYRINEYELWLNFSLQIQIIEECTL